MSLRLGYSFWIDQNFLVQMQVTTIFDEDTCFLLRYRLTSFVLLCLMYTNKFGPSLSLLGERLIKIKAFEDIIEKWPEKVFIISSLNIDVERKEELYLLSGRADAGNIDAILMFYACYLCVLIANCKYTIVKIVLLLLSLRTILVRDSK